MSSIHLDTLGMIHESTCIADIASRLVNNTVCMFHFWAGVKKLTLVAEVFS